MLPINNPYIILIQNGPNCDAKRSINGWNFHNVNWKCQIIYNILVKNIVKLPNSMCNNMIKTIEHKTLFIAKNDDQTIISHGYKSQIIYKPMHEVDITNSDYILLQYIKVQNIKIPCTFKLWLLIVLV